jgi:phage terminase large subunit
MADSAEPKSIDEIKEQGISILGATKGQGSVLQGIQFVQQQKISMTKRSLNLIKSYRNYLWKEDKDGKIINEPNHLFSDAMDAVRYGLSGYKQSILSRPDYNIKINNYG